MREEAARVGMAAVSLQCVHLAVGEGHQLDICHPCVRTQVRTRTLAGGYPVLRLAYHDVLAGQVGDLPEQLVDDCAALFLGRHR